MKKRAGSQMGNRRDDTQVFASLLLRQPEEEIPDLARHGSAIADDWTEIIAPSTGFQIFVGLERPTRD